MEDLGNGEAYRDITVLGDEHSAERFGNVGVNVAGTPALIALPETAAHTVLRPHLGAHQGTVGINVSVDHLATAHIGAKIVASAAVKSVDGIPVTFDVEADWKTPSWWPGFTGARMSTSISFWRPCRSSQSD